MVKKWVVVENLVVENVDILDIFLENLVVYFVVKKIYKLKIECGHLN